MASAKPLTRIAEHNKMDFISIFKHKLVMNASPYQTHEIEQLVHDFYARVHTHPTLGPLFDEHIQDWDTHLTTMVEFWSSLLMRTGSYTGSPMQKHAQLPMLRAELFHTWLDLFHATSSLHPNPQLARHAQEYAQRIARSLWMGYQINQQPDHAPSELNYVPLAQPEP